MNLPEPVQRDKWRPKLHYSAKRHWLNDPNGLIYYQGIYHLYYQTNPGGSHWANMHWGHAVSHNLLDWEEQPIALNAEPEGLGYAFSGGALVDWANTSGLGDGKSPAFIATYTQHSQTGVQVQSLAVSRDGGQRFVPYAGNPVIANPGLADFRDPKVIWYAPGNYWVMVLVAGDCAHFYRSDNLREWSLLSRFGQNISGQGGIWECPDMFPLLCQESGHLRWVLLISLSSGGPAGGSATQYFIGDFDGQCFTPEHSDTRWLDYGPDCYAGITWDGLPTGERILIAWMSNWQYANHTPTRGWRGTMTLPRRLSLLPVQSGFRLVSLPVDTLKARRSKGLVLCDQPMAALFSDRLASYLPDTFELELHLQFGDKPMLMHWRLSNEPGEYLDLTLDTARAELQLDRRRAGWDQQGFGRVARAPLPPGKGELQLRILVDACSIEIFVAEGYSCLTACCYPTKPLSQLDFHLQQGDLDSFRLVCYGLSGNTPCFSDVSHVVGDDKSLA